MLWSIHFLYNSSTSSFFHFVEVELYFSVFFLRLILNSVPKFPWISVKKTITSRVCNWGLSFDHCWKKDLTSKGLQTTVVSNLPNTVIPHIHSLRSRLISSGPLSWYFPFKCNAGFASRHWIDLLDKTCYHMKVSVNISQHHQIEKL